MIINDTIITVDNNLLDCYLEHPHQSVFFDIETTGLHRKYSQLYLVGAIFFDHDNWKLRQWFSQKPADEPLLLQSFLTFIQDYQYIIHYNGDAFDLPYLRSRCGYCQLNATALDPERLISIDLYRQVRPFRELLKMAKMTLKDVEQFLHIERRDPFSGADLIGLYHEYLLSGDRELLNSLLLHNAEDVLHLPQVLPMLNYQRLFTADTDTLVTTRTDDDIMLTLTLTTALPEPITYHNQLLHLSATGYTLTICVSLFRGELKYFFDNPKDYYYLTTEDYAIHKSVGAYVDQAHRCQANRSNCYQRQCGLFAPQYDRLFTPVMKAAAKDKQLFFPCDRLDLLPDDWEVRYADHLLKTLQQQITKK